MLFFTLTVFSYIHIIILCQQRTHNFWPVFDSTTQLRKGKVEEIMVVANLSPETLALKSARYQALEQTAQLFQLDSNLKEQIFGISIENQARMQKDNAILDPLVIDRLNRFNRITQQTIDLFEDTKKAIQWLQTPKVNLAGATPLAALSTDQGAKQVEEILYRTEYGIYG